MSRDDYDVRAWLLERLERTRESPRVLVRDALRLLPEADGGVHAFARENGFTVIVAATNLVFRELYEQATADPDPIKLLVIDRAPVRRRAALSTTKAPPPFYPDLLAETPEEARIDLDLREFLKEATGDPNWPYEANEPRYAKLIVQRLPAVLQAHRNLRAADRDRFTDHDFKVIVAFAALGVADSAFKRLDADDYWRIGLLGHDALGEIDALAPEVARAVKDQLAQAPKPFCWFATHDPDTVLRAFYLSALLAQHTENWTLLVANIDPGLKPFAAIEPSTLADAMPKLVGLDANQARRDLAALEDSLDAETLQRMLTEYMGLSTSAGFASVIEHEQYSTLVRSLALLVALDNVLFAQPAREEHARVTAVLFPPQGGAAARFVDTRPSSAWSNLKEAYRLASDIQEIKGELTVFLKNLRVQKPDKLSFVFFRNLWNDKRVNRLEYYLSALERLIDSGETLPRSESDLPVMFVDAVHHVQQSVRRIATEVRKALDEVNAYFQLMVAAHYPSWVATDGEVWLTSQFVRRCLKPHWDPRTEQAVVFVFDGMRYDIWDELLRPMLEDSMEIVADLPASSLLPSATRVSRWAIAAGAEPAQFYPPKAESMHLQKALADELGLTAEVKDVAPEGSGTGETVRYRAGALDYYIFEFCDKELHKIGKKTLPDGRVVPTRPLSFLYQQHLKSIIDNEVMSIVRRLKPGTKVFIVADHGFGPVGDEKLWFNRDDLHTDFDCAYLYAKLAVPFNEARLPRDKRDNMIAFTPAQLGMPTSEAWTDKKTGDSGRDEYGAIVFPKTGYAFSRPGSPFKPDAYAHGGISLQELMIPMIVLRMKGRDEGLLTLSSLSGPHEVVEGEEIEVRTRLAAAPRGGLFDETRADVEANYTQGADGASLPSQVHYVSMAGVDVVYRFRPDPNDATDEERRAGRMERTLTLTASYRQGRRTIRTSRTHRFAVQLNAERVIRRVPAGLGNILGLTPRGLRG